MAATERRRGGYDAVPEELRERRQWMCWKKGAPKPDGGGFGKPPVSPHTGYVAGHKEPRNRGTFEEAVAAVGRYGLDGVGFVPIEGDPFTFVDLDGCRDPETGRITEGWVREWIEAADTYAEASPSGTGLRIVARGSVPRSINADGVEMYSSGQFLTITGDRLAAAPAEIRDAQGALDELYGRYAGRRDGRPDLKIDEAEPPVRLDERGLRAWRGEEPATKPGSRGEVDRSATLFKIACRLAEAGATARAVRAAVAERDVALGYRKYLDRPQERAEREYTRIAVNAAAKAHKAPGGPSSPSSALVPGDGGDDDGRPSRLRVVRFADLAPVPDRRPYVVRELLPAKFPSAIYGEGGVAKSVIAASLLQAVARGDADWMGFAIEAPAPGLYVDFELDEEEQNRRMRHLALGRDPAGGGAPPDGLYYLCAAAHPARDVLQLALDECRRLGVGLMVLDSLGVALQGDAEAARDVIGFFRDYVDPFRAAGVAVLLVDHQSKRQSGDDYHAKSLFGSVYKGNLTRSVFQVEPTGRGEDELTVRLRHQKANFGPKFDPFEVRISFTEAWVRLERVDLDAADLASEGSLFAKDKVRLALQDGPMFPEGIAEATGLALGTVQNKITRLKKEGLVETTGEKDGNNAQEVRLVVPGSSSPPPRTRGRDGDDGDEGPGGDPDDDDPDDDPAGTFGEVLDALRRFRDDDPEAFRERAPHRLTYTLRERGYLGGEPRYLEVVDALGALDVTCGGQSAEDLRRAHVHEQRVREVRARREISARRRLDAGDGLSAQESDRLAELRGDEEALAWAASMMPKPDWRPEILTEPDLERIRREHLRDQRERRRRDPEYRPTRLTVGEVVQMLAYHEDVKLRQKRVREEIREIEARRRPKPRRRAGGPASWPTTRTERRAR